MTGDQRSWVCCQLGAREHFMLPVGLHRRRALDRLVTDLWIPPGSLIGQLAPRLRDRFHPALDGCVTAFNAASAWFELGQAVAGASGWDRMFRRNKWFQSRAVEALQAISGSRVLVSYSYAARQLFRHARSRGWPTVLIQIDPGLAEERLVERQHAAHPGIERWQPAPPEYWEHWREEIALADRIVVHSPWSRDALIGLGLPAEKLVVIPLAYEPPAAAKDFHRNYPERFTGSRPLRVLFLGTVNLRKGLVALLDAARELGGEPVEFVIAGPNLLHDAARHNDMRIRWIGPVPRGRTGDVYRDADVFLFPTLSDGFGLTQLEAQAWKLPVMATRNCGPVVVDGVNGVTLPASDGGEIAAVLRRMIAEPQWLATLSANSSVHERHAPDRFAAALLESVPVGAVTA